MPRSTFEHRRTRPAVLPLVLDVVSHRVCSAGRHPTECTGWQGGCTWGRKREGYPRCCEVAGEGRVVQ